MLNALIALQHADTAFPNGGFAFSNGIEGLAALSLPFDVAALRCHVESALRHRWATMDRRALVWAHRAGTDIGQLARLDHVFEASSLVEPFRTGSRRAGRAFLTTHARLATPGVDRLRDAVANGRLLGHLPVIQGSVWASLGLRERDGATMAGYQAVTGLVSAAVRLGRVGAIEAQGVIRDLIPVLVDLLEEPVPAADCGELNSFAPLVDVAALRGGGDGARLFSN